ncbi:MAG: hypothetical protein R3344_00660 [Acidobacteriota bacterium]|nr:hypothetical protein [Acidobacteriota bacterium]
MGSTIGLALVHTLIPDHWLPFVLVGRSRGWSLRATAGVSGLSALIHVVLSVGLGYLAYSLGREAAERLGESLEQASAAILVVFGVVYAVWAWSKRGHFHPGGRWLHGKGDSKACEGSEGIHDEHLHYHADSGIIRGSTRAGRYFLALIIGLNPCVLFIPLLLVSVRQGGAATTLVVVSYAVTTFVLMVGLSVAGVGIKRGFAPPGVSRFMEAASGLLIALTGVVFWFLH